MERDLSEGGKREQKLKREKKNTCFLFITACHPVLSRTPI